MLQSELFDALRQHAPIFYAKAFPAEQSAQRRASMLDALQAIYRSRSMDAVCSTTKRHARFAAYIESHPGRAERLAWWFYDRIWAAQEREAAFHASTKTHAEAQRALDNAKRDHERAASRVVPLEKALQDLYLREQALRADLVEAEANLQVALLAHIACKTAEESAAKNLAAVALALAAAA